MEQLDATIIVTALPQMASTFHLNPARMSLGVTSYVLAMAACLPASAWLADRWGARNLFVGAIGVFVIASMLCGLAPNFSAFVAARILQGAAAAMMSPVGRLVVLRTAQKSELMLALSTLVWPALFAPVLGPPLGGFITEAASWRWVFYVNLPLGLIWIVLVLALLPDQKPEERRPFDGRGFALMAVALASLTSAVDLISARQGPGLMTLWEGLGLLGLGLAVGWAAIRHLDRAAHPLVDLEILRQHTFFISAVIGGLPARAAISAGPFLLPLMFQIGYGLSPVQSGLMLLLYMAANLIAKTVTTPIIRRFGLRSVLTWNAVIAGLALAACAIISPGLPLVFTGLLLCAAGGSRSLQLSATSMTSFAEVTPEQRSSASVLSSLCLQIGISMGVALGALMLSVSQALRGATSLGLLDFKIAIVLSGLLCALSAWPFATLARDVGHEMSGRKPSRGVSAA
jgi:EmrB/QacA subfamily drug resistance transporter